MALCWGPGEPQRVCHSSNARAGSRCAHDTRLAHILEVTEAVGSARQVPDKHAQAQAA